MISIKEDIDINSELETPEYEAELQRHYDISNSLIRCLAFCNMNCSRSEEMPKKLFFLSIIDDIFQSSFAITILAREGVRNTCRRELRYLIEAAIKSCFISQKYSEKTVQGQLEEYKKELKSTDISIVDDIDFYMLSDENRVLFKNEIKRMYGYTSKYIHTTPEQIQERFMLNSKGRTIGMEGLTELKEFNDELEKVYSFVLVLLFHSVPKWCAGDYLVERDGSTIDWYFAKSKYLADIDGKFDYKYERQANISDIVEKRKSNIKF